MTEAQPASTAPQHIYHKWFIWVAFERWCSLRSQFWVPNSHQKNRDLTLTFWPLWSHHFTSQSLSL